MQRPIRNLGVIVIILFTALILTNCNGSGGSAPPPPPPTGMPDPPTSVIATAVSNTQVQISWSDVSDASSYSVYRSEATGAAYTFTVVSGTTATIVSDATVTAGTTYYYVISGTNSFGEGPLSAEVSATPATPSGTLTITGTIKYEDKEYNQSVGLTGVTSIKAVRFADVELVNVTDNVTIASSTTATGYYRFDVSAASYGGRTVYVRVESSSVPVGANRVNVFNLTPQLYSVGGARFALAGSSTVNLYIPVTNAADGAFNILDVCNSGSEFVDLYAVTAPPNLNVYWQSGNPYGTYYCYGGCPRGDGIYVYSSYDTDEFDDDVLWHEFGHFVAHQYSKDDSPGGNHFLDDNTQDLRLSWSEGWGNFFPTAVKFWLDTTTPELLSADPATPLSQYVDTETGAILLTVNIGAPEPDTCTADNCMYATNEISNANVLWNTMNTPVLGMDKIWNVFESSLPLTTHEVNIEDFWDGWLASYPTDSSALHTVFNGRLIDYSADSYETDNAVVSAQTFTVGLGQLHRIYGNGDLDYVVFTVPTSTQYTIRTSSLRNGADTYLTLFDSTGTNIITFNDNATSPPSLPPNDITALSSRIVQNLVPGTYYVSVNSSQNKPSSAGRYGSYVLTISP